MGRKISLRVCVFFGFFMWVEFSVLYPLVSEICYFYFTLKFLKFWLLPSTFLKISLLPSSFWNSNGRPCAFEIPHNALIVYFWNSLICPFLFFPFLLFLFCTDTYIALLLLLLCPSLVSSQFLFLPSASTETKTSFSPSAYGHRRPSMLLLLPLNSKAARLCNSFFSSSTSAIPYVTPFPHAIHSIAPSLENHV